jgi:hypothetical protein
MQARSARLFLMGGLAVCLGAAAQVSARAQPGGQAPGAAQPPARTQPSGQAPGAAQAPASTQPGGQAPGTTVAYTTDIVATVESIDQRTRHVVLRGPNGGRMSVVVGPAVENLSKVRAGDKVRVHYVEALAASLAKPEGTGSNTVTQRGGLARGETASGNPSGTVGNQVRGTVVVQGVDRASNTITFTGPGNVSQTVSVRDPDAQRFIATLQPGDRVDVTYTESVALDLEPQGR